MPESRVKIAPTVTYPPATLRVAPHVQQANFKAVWDVRTAQETPTTTKKAWGRVKIVPTGGKQTSTGSSVPNARPENTEQAQVVNPARQTHTLTSSEPPPVEHAVLNQLILTTRDADVNRAREVHRRS